MADKQPMVMFAASYDTVPAALEALDDIEQLHKDQMIGKFDAAVIDKENGKPASSSAWTARESGSFPSWPAPARCPAKSSRRLPAS